MNKTEIKIKSKEYLLKEFMEENFDFDSLREVGLFDESIKREDYKSQARRICAFFGYDSIYQYGFKTVHAHISYSDDERDNKPFITEFKAWHED